MGGDHKRTLITEDRFSNLPESLIVSILECLPIQDAVKTCILSKNWRYKYTTMTSLVFDEQFSLKFADNGAFGHNGFIRNINQLLFFHKGSILKFYLHLPDMILDSFRELDQWMLSLSRNGVQELHLVNYTNQRYQLPSYIFSCLELRTLNLDNCIFKLPLRFHGFHKLENLNLTNIKFVATLSGIDINLPQLESLTLSSCTNLTDFNIKAPKLETLSVIFCPGAMMLRLLMHSQCIYMVSVLIDRAIQEIEQAERSNMTTVLLTSNLPETAAFNGYFLKLLIAEAIPKRLSRPVNTLKTLSFIRLDFGDLEQIQGALWFLRNSPNLKKLRISNDKRARDNDGRPVLNYLKSLDCLDQTLNLLETVQINHIDGSRPEQLLFIKLLLAHSPYLTKFTIKPWGSSKRFKDVMRFPRASQKAEFVFLDPQQA